MMRQPASYPCHYRYKELHMTSWITWEIWWNRVWGESEMLHAREEEHEVAHEPSRLPVELLAQGRGDRPG